MKELFKNNVKVKGYRAEKGRFAELVFNGELEKCNQATTYCRVGAHGQNGIIGRHISKITDLGQIMLLYSKGFWTKAITRMLWSFSVAEDIRLKKNFDT